MKKWIIYLSIAAAVLLLFGVIGKNRGWFGKEQLTKVAVEKAEVREIIGMVSATGKIYPDKEVVISPEVPGEIIELYVEEGDSVQEGQLLAKIRADDYETAINRNISTLNNTRAGVEQAEAGIAQARAQLEQSRSRVAQAEAQYKNSKAEFDRNKKLYDQKLISQRDYATSELQVNTAQADLTAAQSAVLSAEEAVNASEATKKASEYTVKSVGLDVQQARTSYQKTIIRAPQSGIISKLNVEKGERVVGTSQMAGTELMTIADLKNMECRIEVSENDIVRVNIGDTCNIEVDAYYGKVFKGVVTKISNSLGSGSTSAAAALNPDQVTNFLVTVNILPESYKELQDRRFPFRPGMSASVDIITDKVNNKVTVPVISVIAKSKDEYKEMVGDSTLKGGNERNEYVYLVENGRTKIVPIDIGIGDSEYYVVNSGVSEGQEVVVAPYEAIERKLKNDEDVDVVPKDEVYSTGKRKKKSESDE